MAICTRCGIVLEASEVVAHNALMEVDHEANKAKIKDDQRVAKGLRAT